MHPNRLTHILLATIAALLLWNVLAPGQHAVHARSFPEYKVVDITGNGAASLEKMLSQLGQEGWAFKQVTGLQGGRSERYLILERQ